MLRRQLIQIAGMCTVLVLLAAGRWSVAASERMTDRKAAQGDDHEIGVASGANEKASTTDEPAVPPDSRSGTLVGRFIMDGKLPPRVSVVVDHGRSILGQGSTPTREVDGARIPAFPDPTGGSRLVENHPSLLVGKDGGIANMLIWVRSKDIHVAEREPEERQVFRYVDGQFQPRLLAFQSPQTIVLRNEDKESGQNFNWHGFRSDKFNSFLPAGSSVEVRFVHAERGPMPLTGQMQGQKKSWLFPCAHSFFAVSEMDGTFQIANLPAGEWEFQMWHERSGLDAWDNWPNRRFTMKIKPGLNDLGTVKLAPSMLGAFQNKLLLPSDTPR